MKRLELPLSSLLDSGTASNALYVRPDFINLNSGREYMYPELSLERHSLSFDYTKPIRHLNTVRLAFLHYHSLLSSSRNSGEILPSHAGVNESKTRLQFSALHYICK